MATSKEICTKACKVICSITDLEHIPVITSYAVLAEKQIHKKWFSKNYEYIAMINNTLQWKCQDLINQRVLKWNEG